MQREIEKLIFIYDASSGKLAAMADSLKKLVGRGCPLCAVTHGLARKRSSWEQYESELAVPITYLHADELGDIPDRHPSLELPCVLAELGDGEQIVILDAKSLRRARGTEADLKGRLEFRAAALGLTLPYRSKVDRLSRPG